jgi:hypothetical protein
VIQEWDGHGNGRDEMQTFGQKPWGKRPHARPRHRWEDAIKMDLQKNMAVRYKLDSPGTV